VESPSLLSLLRRKGVSLYLVQWVGSFLRDRTWRLTFQGSPRLFAPFSVGYLRDLPSPLFCSTNTSPRSTWKSLRHLLCPTSTTLRSLWPRPPTEPTFASFRRLSHRSRERPPLSTSPSPFQRPNSSTGGLPGAMNRHAPSRCSWKINSSIHNPA